jgi:hypothetical protein
MAASGPSASGLQEDLHARSDTDTWIHHMDRSNTDTWILGYNSLCAAFWLWRPCAAGCGLQEHRCAESDTDIWLLVGCRRAEAAGAVAHRRARGARPPPPLSPPSPSPSPFAPPCPPTRYSPIGTELEVPMEIEARSFRMQTIGHWAARFRPGVVVLSPSRLVPIIATSPEPMVAARLGH